MPQQLERVCFVRLRRVTCVLVDHQVALFCIGFLYWLVTSRLEKHLELFVWPHMHTRQEGNSRGPYNSNAFSSDLPLQRKHTHIIIFVADCTSKEGRWGCSGPLHVPAHGSGHASTGMADSIAAPRFQSKVLRIPSLTLALSLSRQQKNRLQHEIRHCSIHPMCQRRMHSAFVFRRVSIHVF